MRIGDNLKAARKSQDLNSEAAAEKLGIAYNTLNKYENNHVIPQADLLVKMCHLYKCDPNKILGFKGAVATEGKSGAGIPVVGKIFDRTNFVCDFNTAATEHLPLSSTEPDVYAMRVASNAMAPIVFSGEYLIFKRPPQQNIMEITMDDQLLRGEPVGKIFGTYRKRT